MKALSSFTLFFLLYLFSSECIAQPYVKLSFPQVSDKGLKVNNDNLITFWNTENGLPQNSVNDIVQRSDGFIFFATNDGLVRFDGVRFKDYRFQDYPEMLNNRIKDLFIDKNDIIYLVTESNSISAFRDEKFTVIAQGNYRRNFGLFSVTHDGNVYYDDEQHRLIKYSGGKRTQVSVPFNTDLAQVRKMLIRDEARMIFIRTDSTFIWDNGKLISLRTRGVPGKYSLPHTTSDDNRFLLNDGLAVYEIKSGRITLLINYDQEYGEINDVLGVGSDTWYIATGSGVLQYKNGKIISVLSTLNGLPSDVIKSLLADNNGGILLGSYDAGLIRISERVFKSLNVSHGLKNESINPVLIRKNGNLLIGTNGSGVFELKDQKLINELFPGRFVWSLLETSDNSIYAGLASNKIAVKSPSGRFHDINIPIERGITPTVTTLFEEKQGIIWIGTTIGLYKLENEKISLLPSQTGITFHIHDIRRDPSGLIWIAGQDGLIRYDGKKFRRYDKNDNEGLSYVRTIFTSGDEIWLGTYGNGLIHFKNGKFTRITHRNGLFDNSISSIHLDNQGIFWFSSNKGVFAVDKREIDNVINGKETRVSFIKFGRNDGMISRECNGGFTPSSAADKNGMLYIPTISGVVFFNPAEVKKEKLSTPVIIEGYEINNSFFNFEDQRNLELPFGNDRITFYVNSPYFNDNHNLLYKYKLEGFSDSWVWQSYMNNVISFTSLPPGKYKLHVKAYYAFRENEANETSLEITVLPPFYLTGSFIFFLIIALILLVVLIIRLREKSLRRKRKELENTVNERTSELSEKNYLLENLNLDLAASREELLLKNQTLMQREEELLDLNASKDLFMTIISHDLRNPLFSISSFADILEDEEEQLTKSERSEMLVKIKTLSKNLYELLNNLLAWAKIQGGKAAIEADIFDMNQLIEENMEILQGVANQKSVRLRARLQNEIPHAFADKPMISSVIRNLVTNAIKFSHPESEILLSTDFSDNFLKVSVKDSGVGIPEIMKDKLFRIDSKTTTKGTGDEKGSGVGLILSHEIIQKNGGNIWFESAEGLGTTFHFTVPSADHREPALTDN